MLAKVYEYIKKFIKYNYKLIIFFVIVLLIVLFLGYYKLPYIVYKPGGSINLSSRVEVEGKDGINGSYSMNFVTVSRGNIPNVLLSYLIKDWELVKEEELTAGYVDYETMFKLEQLDYKNSIFLAISNACRNDLCKIDITKENIYVMYIDERADTDLQVLDEIISIDGKKVTNFYDIKDYVKSRNIGDKINFKVLVNGKEYDRYANVIDVDGYKIIGVTGYTTYEYTTTPNIEIKTKKSEAGASGGLMLTLAIYDYLSDEDIAKNRKIMGTGTIDSEGNIGEIGGVKYKMLGAKKDKADIFFVPMNNCEEAFRVKEEYNIKYEIKCVATFEEAVNFLTSK